MATVRASYLLSLSVWSLVACAAAGPVTTPVLSGAVTFPAGRTAQSSTSDVARAATVSLIDPATSRTIATTLTAPDGSFSLSLANFRPKVQTYYLEAVKGLFQNQAGNDAARLRTLVRWGGAGWSALTTNDASIGFSTTAIAAIVAVRALYPEPFIGKLAPDAGAPYGYTFNGGSDLTFTQEGSPRTVTQGELTYVTDLANQALSADRDPLGSLLYAGSSYSLRPLNNRPFIYFALPNPASEGDTVTLQGGNFIATASMNVVRLNGLPVSVVSGDAERLVLTVPSGATTGTLEVGTPSGTGSCPLRITPTVTGDVSSGPAPTPEPASGTDISGNLLGRYRLGGRP